MKKIKIVFVSLAALLLQLSIALAGEDQIVIDDLTPAQLRAEIDKVQKEFYRVFNTLNKDPSLTIVCHEYKPTGSNINQTACEPQFVIDRRGKNAADSQLKIDELLTPEALRDDLAEEFRKLTEAMNTIGKDSQYFKDLNTILGVLRERLEEIT